MNISSIKTPGVYINEIDAFPQSVAAVSTAIPAFVGYTEKAPALNVPTRIVSMLEYNQLFGGAPQLDDITIVLNSYNMPISGTEVGESIYKLYTSMQLFFANGGGSCWIVPVGTYGTTPASMVISQTELEAGIDSLESVDEPTLLLFPDAVNLDADVLGIVQQRALLQCQNLMDRFAILDVKDTNNLSVDSEAFRDGVGTIGLKYGASYYPYLQISADRQYNFAALNTALGGNGFKRFSPGDTDLNAAIDNYMSSVTTTKTLNTAWGGTKPELEGATDSPKTKTDLETLWAQLAKLGKPNAVTNTGLKQQFDQLVTYSLLQYGRRLADFAVEYNSLNTNPTTPVVQITIPTSINSNFNGTWGTSIISNVNNPNTFLDSLSNTVTDGSTTYKQVNYVKVENELIKLNNAIYSALASAFTTFDTYNNYQQSLLVSRIPMYGIITAKLNESLSAVPPSGAVAGIYAQNDNTRGVWKAPANIGVNGIVGLSIDINDRQQEDMNISSTGKSINAIRKFTGQGFLVWGARTLDGNSNDWRYINVRRTANFIEESVQEACMHYVFEPNVAQTWVNVKAMIENFLTTVWNDGGLAGAKPQQAFFVQIGLGQTMTAQDVNEGRMIVKVGYAPTRPAEFIIVEFKQMLQQS